MNGEFYTVHNQHQLGHFLRYATEFDLPFRGQLKPVKTEKTNRLLRRIHATIDDIAAHKGAKPEHVKDDCKLEFGKYEVQHSHISGQKRARLYSFTTYSDDELRNFIGELEVYCAENQIGVNIPEGL